MVKLFEKRKCCRCNMFLRFRAFVISTHREGILIKLGKEMLYEIWKNPIFVLECCVCFNRYSFPWRRLK